MEIDWQAELASVGLVIQEEGIDAWFAYCSAFPHGKVGPCGDAITALMLAVGYLVAAVRSYQNIDVGPFRRLLDQLDAC